MKRFLAIITAMVLLAVSLVGSAASQPFIIPEVMTVEINENGGYSDYIFVDGNGNELELFNSSYTPDEVNEEDLLYTSAVASIPSSYDSRTLNCITPPKQQGVSGNCWAFSAMSMLETDAILKGLDDIETADYSEAHFSWFTSRSLTDNVDDPTYGDGYLDEDPYITGGNWIISAGSLARWKGAAEDADYPFDYRDLSKMGNYDESSRYDTGSGIIIESAQSLLGMDDAKSWIMEHGSATLSFYYANEYYNSSSCAYFYNGTEPINHEITVIGWNDNYSRYNFRSSNQPSGNGAWLCKNSWGLNWGNNGYFWLSYYDTSIEQFSGISARSVDDAYRNYTYNGTAWESYISHVGNAKISNVFTSKGSELLTSVSTYTISPDSEIVISVYKNLPKYFQNPEQGTRAYTKTIVVDRPGYHVIDLDTEIALSKGTVFSVVIEYVTDGTTYLPLEATGRGKNAYYSNAKESYLYLPAYNSGWYDAKSYNVQNAFVQAFTKCNHNTVSETVYATCDVDGFEKTTCTLCGKVVSETVFPAFGHDFSEWSNYVHDFENDCEVRTRTCSYCELVESEFIVYAKNTIKLEDFLQMIFGKIFGIFGIYFK